MNNQEALKDIELLKKQSKELREAFKVKYISITKDFESFIEFYSEWSKKFTELSRKIDEIMQFEIDFLGSETTKQ